MKDFDYGVTLENGQYIHIPDIDTLCIALRCKFEDQLEKIEYLQDKLNEVKSSAYKDKELAKMKAKYDLANADLRRGFPVSAEESKKITTWISEHEKTCNNQSGAIGGKYIYEFIPTGIGVVGTIKCSHCNKEFTFKELQ